MGVPFASSLLSIKINAITCLKLKIEFSFSCQLGITCVLGLLLYLYPLNPSLQVSGSICFPEGC